MYHLRDSYSIARDCYDRYQGILIVECSEAVSYTHLYLGNESDYSEEVSARHLISALTVHFSLTY